MIITAVDPGRTSGFVTLSTSSWKFIRHEEVKFEDALMRLSELLDAPDVIVVERFTVSMRTIRATRQMEASYLIGAIMYWGIMSDRPVILQSASDAKTAFGSRLIATAGLWTKSPHTRDATRHALLVARRNGYECPKVKPPQMTTVVEF